MARYLDKLNQIAAAAGTVADLTRATQVYTYAVPKMSHVYIHASSAEVRVTRRVGSEVAIAATLQPPFAWNIGAEQDERGVYFVALRKPIVGTIATGKFEVTAPPDAHIILKLDGARLVLENVSETIELPSKAG